MFEICLFVFIHISQIEIRRITIFIVIKIVMKTFLICIVSTIF